jgi:hypothetical protein
VYDIVAQRAVVEPTALVPWLAVRQREQHVSDLHFTSLPRLALAARRSKASARAKLASAQRLRELREPAGIRRSCTTTVAAWDAAAPGQGPCAGRRGVSPRTRIRVRAPWSHRNVR